MAVRHFGKVYPSDEANFRKSQLYFGRAKAGFANKLKGRQFVFNI